MTSAEDLYRRVHASAERLTSLRHALVRWARGLGLPAWLVRELERAVYEALANAVEHAYLSAERPGPVELEAGAGQDGTVWVRVSDHGNWRDPTRDRSVRGRGLPLMRALSDRTEIATTDRGTSVTMTWSWPDTAESEPAVARRSGRG